MKRFLSLLTLCALLCAAALSTPVLAEETPIVFWHSMSGDAGLLVDGFVKAFNEGAGKDLGVRVEGVYQGKYSDAVTRMNSVLSTGNVQDLPDVMNMDATGKVIYATSGAAYTVDAALQDHPEDSLAGLLEGALANWRFAGAQLGMPFATSTTVTYYNKTLLDAAGAQAPETLQDIAALKAVLPDKTAGGQDLTVYAALPNTPSLANWLGQMGSYLTDLSNGADGAATKLACVENGALADFLAAWKALYASGALKNAEVSSDVFVAGQLAVYTNSSSNLASLMEKIGGAFELGVTFYPKVNEGAALGATASGSCLCMFDKGDDAKKAAAWAFVSYMVSPEVQAAFAAGTGYTPASVAATETDIYKALLAEHPQYAVAVEQLSVTPPDMRSVTIGPSIDFYYAIQDGVSSMLLEDWTVEETVATMQSELEGLLTRYAAANQ